MSGRCVLRLLGQLCFTAGLLVAAFAAGGAKPAFGPNVLIFGPSMPSQAIPADQYREVGFWEISRKPVSGQSINFDSSVTRKRVLSGLNSSPVACQKPIALYYGRRSFTTCAVSSLFRQASVGEEVPSPRPRIQVVHGTVPQKYARNTLPAPSGILSRPALGELRCHPLPTSSTRAPEATPN
jgi:hypothetical protein